MGINLKYRLNTEELTRILIDKRWGLGELSEVTGISKAHLWRMSLAPDDKNFSFVGSAARKKLREVFPEAKNILLPILERNKS